MPGLVDHLWQSVCVCGVIALLAWIVRNAGATFRVWLLRIAAIKFVLPFALLFALGGWVGFPVVHTADPAPPSLIRALDALTPITSPARAHAWTQNQVLLAMPGLLACAGACGYWLRHRLRIERQRVQDEAARRAIDVNDVVQGPGFLPGALLTACALAALSLPLLAGALEDRQRDLERLAANSAALSRASMALTPAAPGMGSRHRMSADEHGVSLRNINIQDLVATVYGVNHYAVIGNQMYDASDPDARSWLTSPRYDIRVIAPIPEPEAFDAYALRQTVTRFLVAQFGLEIRENGECQLPCGRYDVGLANHARALRIHPTGSPEGGARE